MDHYTKIECEIGGEDDAYHYWEYSKTCIISGFAAFRQA